MFLNSTLGRLLIELGIKNIFCHWIEDHVLAPKLLKSNRCRILFDLFRLLYVNYRAIDSNHPDNGPLRPGYEEEDIMYRVFREDITLACIDMQTMRRCEGVEYRGHVGYSAFPAWYICTDISHDYIARQGRNEKYICLDYRISTFKTWLVVKEIFFWAIHVKKGNSLNKESLLFVTMELLYVQ